MPNKTKWDFRDVSGGLQTIREFFLGRKYVFHHRFLPILAPRSIPPPDIPRGPEYKYSKQYYGNRDVLNSVKPPVVAPVAEGFKSGARGTKTCSSTEQGLKFPSELPTPGCVWWFDAHCYFKEVYFQPCGPPSEMPCAPPPPSPCAPYGKPPPCPCPPPEDEHPSVVVDPCAVKKPCKLEPCKVEKVLPPQPPPICDPCKEEDPKKKC